MFWIPSAFSIFAIIGIYGAPSSLKYAFISRMHSAFRTKDAAIKSISCSTPNLMSSLSFSVIAGSLTGTFGTFTPFRSPSSPPFVILHTISLRVFSRTSSPIRPSSINIVLPTCTSSINPAYVMETLVSSPSISSVHNVNISPVSSETFLPSFSTPVRISGPFVSKRMATGIFSSSLSRFIMSMRAFCSSWVPWEKLKRAISMPSLISFLTISGSFVPGPMVHTIFVFFIFPDVTPLS